MKTLLLLFAFVAAPALAQDGLIKIKSAHAPDATIDRLESILKSKGLTIFAKIAHDENAKKAGLELRETRLLIFGNPKLGSPLMNASATVGIDLPMKALSWTDAQGQTWLAYNDPAYITGRHSASGAKVKTVVGKMQGALKNITAAAAAPAAE